MKKKIRVKRRFQSQIKILLAKKINKKNLR
jgi:hypothetical protein